MGQVYELGLKRKLCSKIHCNPFSGFGETGVRQLYSDFYMHIYVDFVCTLVHHYNNSLVSQ